MLHLHRSFEDHTLKHFLVWVVGLKGRGENGDCKFFLLNFSIV